MTLKPRPDSLKGSTRRLRTGCGKIYVTTNELEGKLYELFTTIGKAGGCAAAYSQAMGRLITKGLQKKLTPEEVVKQLKGISCHTPCFDPKYGKILSCPDATGKIIELYLNGEIKAVKKIDMENVVKEVEIVKEKDESGACPDCGGAITHEEGCEKCPVCDYSRCG